jgi:hypothetical protein
MSVNGNDTLYGGVEIVHIPGLQGPKGKDGVVTPELAAARDRAIEAAKAASDSKDVALSAQNAAKASADASATSAGRAEASAAAASLSEIAASTAAAQAAESLSSANESVSAAAASASAAKSSEDAASASATAAANSASVASAKADAAGDSETAAAGSAAIATSKANAASASATDAAGSATTAASKAGEASASATAAAGSAMTASDLATAAHKSQMEASQASEEAKLHAAAAGDQATIAVSKATASASSAEAASESATQAQNLRDSASRFATEAENSATQAQTYRKFAEDASDEADKAKRAAEDAKAVASEGAAQSSASAVSANSSALAASASAELAQKWAVQTDAPVEEGLYGAKYYATQAAAGQLQADWSQIDISAKDYIKNKPSLAAVAISGAYSDLTGAPTIPTIPTKVSAFENDKGYLTSHQSLDAYATKASLATVATSGSYNDLSGKPTIPAIPTKVSAFENDKGYLTAHQSLDAYATKASLKAVATSGSYNDLSDKPTIPTVPTKVSAFENDKGYLTEHQSLAEYAKKTEIPTVPTKVSAFENDAGYLTQHQSLDAYATKASLKAVATSGSYNDLTDKPAVPTIDSSLSPTSTNAVQNKVINSALDGKLSTSGGTVNGSITINGTTVPVSDSTETYKEGIKFGWGSEISQSRPNGLDIWAKRGDAETILALYGEKKDGDTTGNTPGIYLRAGDGTNTKSMKLSPTKGLNADVYELRRSAGQKSLSIYGADNDGCISLIPGSTGQFSDKKSASLFITSTDYTGNAIPAGSFYLSAMDATTGNKSLAGSPSGSLSWDGTFSASILKATSDKRKKTNITKTSVDLSSLNAYRYEFKKSSDADKGFHVGLIAQEVEKILPEAVSKDEKGFLTLDYNAVVAVLVDEVNQLKSEIKQLQTKLS